MASILRFFDNSLINIAYNLNHFPSNFVEIVDLNELKACYEKTFSKVQTEGTKMCSTQELSAPQEKQMKSEYVLGQYYQNFAQGEQIFNRGEQI